MCIQVHTHRGACVDSRCYNLRMSPIEIIVLLSGAFVLFSSALACGFYLGSKLNHASAYALSPSKQRTHAPAASPAIARKLARNEASTADKVRVISPRNKAQNAIIVSE